MRAELELDDKDLVFLDDQLPFVLASLEESQQVSIQDRSLTMEEVLRLNPSLGEEIDRCTELIGLIQREINVRGIQRA